MVDGTLTVNREELAEFLLKDDRLKKIDVELARPGESVRLIPAKDVVEPRCKLNGGGRVFPGINGGVETVGDGATLALKGSAVVTVGQIVGFQEGLIDMSGPGADYSPFSRTFNVVLVAEPKEGIEAHEYEAALRLAGCRAAEFFALKARENSPDSVQVYETQPLGDKAASERRLPRVVYVYMLQSQGLLHDTYLYGVDVKHILPTFIYPTEVMDGAIVSGNCVSACDKNTTYHHQNNPVIEELYRRDRKDLEFVGVVCTNENVTLLDKERSSWYTSKLVNYLGVEGAVISKEGFGNPDTDMIMNFRKLNAQGIKTVLITDEFPGRDGASPSLADADPEADAVISTGSANQVVKLPRCERIISSQTASERIAGGWKENITDSGELLVELQAVTGATNELGFNRMGAAGY